ncbi:cation diffusion facilitator family transporter [Herbivorax sp. ANBcel31]|uniref:cation diffusion facilitator family transporter n=1 Tax=Herbivorax sp. ANBcel31 TaxID=3069754 RepID=UPI0027AE61AD|nr:cation diffusion facilitator family transporter [Herbivorax sp. ANBcel31]MDQ2085552.1 cation diffusion facilitator family transporter [Herbivorax sp. ANBcel31]
MEQINQSMNTHKTKRIAMKVSKTSIIVNLILSVIKILSGVFGGSGAMISDGVHSASDVFSTFIVIIGFNISSKKPDHNHQYGHERLECVASIILALILATTGIGIGLGGIEKIIGGNYGELGVPSILALIAAIISIGVKEWMYWFTRAAAKKINSGSLMADAWHHRSDSLSSIGAFIGILGARMGFPILDPVASVIICIFICKVAFDIFKEAIDKLVDKSCDKGMLEKIKSVINEQEGVLQIDEIRTRLFGSKIYIDVEIAADGSKSLNETHAIAENVHDAIEKKFVTVKHCMVHVNPIPK